MRAISPYFGRDSRLRIVVDDPATAIDGSVLEGFVYLDDAVPMIIHDPPTGRMCTRSRCWQDPYFGSTSELAPRRKPLVVYAHPDWSPRHGD